MDTIVVIRYDYDDASKPYICQVVASDQVIVTVDRLKVGGGVESLDSDQVLVDPDVAKLLTAPIAIVTLQTEDVLHSHDLRGDTLATWMKKEARRKLEEMGENPSDWGLSVVARAYKYECVATYAKHVDDVHI